VLEFLYEAITMTANLVVFSAGSGNATFLSPGTILQLLTASKEAVIHNLQQNLATNVLEGVGASLFVALGETIFRLVLDIPKDPQNFKQIAADYLTKLIFANLGAALSSPAGGGGFAFVIANLRVMLGQIELALNKRAEYINALDSAKQSAASSIIAIAKIQDIINIGDLSDTREEHLQKMINDAKNDFSTDPTYASYRNLLGEFNLSTTAFASGKLRDAVGEFFSLVVDVLAADTSEGNTREGLWAKLADKAAEFDAVFGTRNFSSYFTELETGLR